MTLLPVACLLSIVLLGADAVCKDPGTLTDFEQAALDKHNELRRLHEGTDDLCYGETGSDISFHSQDWTDHLASIGQTKHSTNSEYYDSSNPYGENLAYAGTSVSSDVREEGEATVYSTQAWYNEIKDWSFAASAGTGGGVTGHFTQVVWRKTKQVNCGYTTYSGGGFYKYVVACQYYPAGNYGGQYADNVGTLKEEGASNDTGDADDTGDGDDTGDAGDDDGDTGDDGDDDDEGDSWWSNGDDGNWWNGNSGDWSEWIDDNDNSNSGTIGDVSFRLWGVGGDSMGVVVASATPEADDSWSFVCNEGVGRREVQAVCKQLGFNTGIRIHPYSLEDQEDLTGDFRATGLSCPASAPGTSVCSWTEYAMTEVPCVDGQQLAVSCADEAWQFAVTRFSAKVKKGRKAKFSCAASANRYGMEMDMGASAEAVILNRNSRGELSFVSTGKKTKYAGGVWKSGAVISDIPSKNRCFICAVKIKGTSIMKLAIDSKCKMDVSVEGVWEEVAGWWVNRLTNRV